MVHRAIRVVWAAIREFAFLVGYWLGITLFLTLVSRIMFSPQRILGANASAQQVQRVRQQLGINDSILAAFVDYLTFDFGQSFVLSPSVPATSLVFESLGRTLFLVIEVAIVGAVLVIPTVGAVALLSDTRIRPLASVPGYLASSLPAVGWLSILFVLQLLGVFSLRIGRRTDPFADPLGALGQILPLAFVLTVPLLGFLARSVHISLAGDGSRRDRLLSRPRGDTLRSLSVEGWLYLSYFGGALIAAETMFSYPGIGSLWFHGYIQGDMPVFISATAVIVLVFVLLGFVQRLVWAIGDVLQVPTSPTSEDSTAPGTEPVADGGTDDTLLTKLRTNYRIPISILALGLFLIVSLIGSVLVSPTRGPGFSLARALDALVVLQASTLLATVVALVLGVPFGTLAARFERPVATVFRGGSGFVMTFPLLVFVTLFLAMLPDLSNSVVLFVIVAGLFGGLALVPYTYRFTHIEVSTRLGSPSDRTEELALATIAREILPAALLPTLGRTILAATVLLFVIAELGMLGVAHHHLGNALGRMSATGELLAIVPVVGLPALLLHVLGDSLRTVGRQS